MWLQVLGLRPVDDPFLCAPLVDVQTRDFLDPLPSEHDDLYRACIGRVNRCVRVFKPAIKPHELLFTEQGGPWTLGSVGMPVAGLYGIRKRRGEVLR